MKVLQGTSDNKWASLVILGRVIEALLYSDIEYESEEDEDGISLNIRLKYNYTKYKNGGFNYTYKI